MERPVTQHLFYSLSALLLITVRESSKFKSLLRFIKIQTYIIKLYGCNEKHKLLVGRINRKQHTKAGNGDLVLPI